MAVRRLYEPLCIAFGTTVSSPTVPTYQLYDLPHKFTPRLYMESEDPNLVLREIGVWAGWEQAGSANTRSFLLDLLKDEDAHDNFLVREAGPTRFRRVRGIIVLTQKHLRIVRAIGTPWLLLEAALLPIILLRHCLLLAAFTWYIWYLIHTNAN